MPAVKRVAVKVSALLRGAVGLQIGEPEAQYV